MFARGGPTLFELARQAMSATDRGYELLAEKFDHTPFRTPTWALDLVEPSLKRLGPFARGLDVCCGTGAATERLLHHCTDEVIGLDRVPAMLEVAAKNLGAHASGSAPTVRWQEGDALALPFDRELDVITSFGAFGHIERSDEGRFVAEVHRALRPGGVFVFLTSVRPGPGRRSWWLARGFNAAMRVRNAVRSPPFIMYYLTFMLPDVANRLTAQGFEVEVTSPELPRPRDLLRVVVARRLG